MSPARIRMLAYGTQRRERERRVEDELMSQLPFSFGRLENADQVELIEFAQDHQRRKT